MQTFLSYAIFIIKRQKLIINKQKKDLTMKAMTRQYNTFNSSISFAPTRKWNKGLVYCNVLCHGSQKQQDKPKVEDY